MAFDSKQERVFSIRVAYRNIAVFGLLLFLTVMIVGGIGMWFEAPADRRLFVIPFVTIGFSVPISIGLWTLLMYFRERLTIRGTRIVHQGIVRTKELDLFSVREVAWRHLVKGGQIILRTPTERMKIHLDKFEPEQRLWLVEFFRHHTTDDIQHGWEMFCYRIAMPLRNHKPPDEQQIGPDEIRLTRRRWDWYFIPLIGFFAVIGAILYFALRELRFLAAPVIPAILWLMVRLQTPRHGLITKRIRKESPRGRLLIFAICWYFAMMASVLLVKAAPLPPAIGTAIEIFVLIVGVGLALVVACRFHYQWRQQSGR